jgi:cytochrome b6-f complex iron-sulfur subunit
MSCEHCLNRREFIARTTLAAAAAAVTSACGNGVFGPPLPTAVTPVGPLTIRVADFPGLATVNQLVAIDIQRAVIKTSDSPPTFRCLLLVCTHQGCLADVANNRVECPCHGSRFNNDGSVLNGPAERPLDQLATSFNAATGELTIT